MARCRGHGAGIVLKKIKENIYNCTMTGSYDVNVYITFRDPGNSLDSREGMSLGRVTPGRFQILRSKS